MALLKRQCVSPKQIETANHSADILSYVSLHFLKGYQTCSRQISEFFLFNGGASENAPSQQIEGSAGLCQEPPGWPRAASFCSMEFTCNIESTSHSLDPADQQQKVNIIIYSPYRFPQILVDSPLGTSGRKKHNDSDPGIQFGLLSDAQGD